MFTRITSSTVYGLDAIPIYIEIDLDKGLFAFIIIGLTDKAIQEAKERISSAIKNSGFSLPRGKITVNLAPADIEKKGSAFDMAIAIGILHAEGKVNINPDKQFFIGELSLDGIFRPVTGVIASIILAKSMGFKEIFIPESNYSEVVQIQGIDIFPVSNLSELCSHLNGFTHLDKQIESEIPIIDNVSELDFKFIKSQYKAKRALEISAAGAHNVLMNGTPGSGKTLLAKAFSSILPSLSGEEQIEVTKIYSSAGLLKKDSTLITKRPFRNPHHSSSLVSIIGGGKFPKPGEITLAHRGVLFLDEFPEFSSQTIESLRQPIEDKIVTVSRANYSYTFPANFILLSAMNPCRCGFAGSEDHDCICSTRDIINYKKKISGPILDRIDLKINVSNISVSDLSSKATSESSIAIKQRVIKARSIQFDRLSKHSKLTNSDIDEKIIEEICLLDTESKRILNLAANKFKMSPRSYFRTIKVARTIADLDGFENIRKENISEALSFRLDIN